MQGSLLSSIVLSERKTLESNSRSPEKSTVGELNFNRGWRDQTYGNSSIKRSQRISVSFLPRHLLAKHTARFPTCSQNDAQDKNDNRGLTHTKNEG